MSTRASGTLSANDVETVTIELPPDKQVPYTNHLGATAYKTINNRGAAVRVVNLDGEGAIWFTVDGTDPEVEGSDRAVPATAGAFNYVRKYIQDEITVKLISDEDTQYTVEFFSGDASETNNIGDGGGDGGGAAITEIEVITDPDDVSEDNVLYLLTNLEEAPDAINTMKVNNAPVTGVFAGTNKLWPGGDGLSYLQAILADSSPFGVWLLNDTDLSGSNVWLDSSGNGWNSTDEEPPTPTPTTLHGGLTSAASFDGVDDVIHVVTGHSADAASVSVEAWVNTTASDFRVLNHEDPAESFFKKAFNARVTSTGIEFAIHVGGGMPEFEASCAVTDGNWHHVVWAYDENDGFSAYLDGELVGTDDTAGPINGSEFDIRIGCSYSNYFSANQGLAPGELAGVAFHKGYALSSEQVLAHYNAGLSGSDD